MLTASYGSSCCRIFIRTALSIILLGCVRVPSFGQTCGYEPSGGNVTTIEKFGEVNKSCVTATTLTPDGDVPASSDVSSGGAFVKIGAAGAGSFVALDSRATSSGQCLLKAWQYSFPTGWTCVLVPITPNPQLRYVAKIRMGAEPPGYLPTNFYVYALGGATLQDMDSREPNTTGGTSVLLSIEGQYRFDFESTIVKTACNIEPGASEIIDFTANALTCRPNWWLIGVGPTNLRVPQGPIKIYIPPTMYGDLIGPATDAVNRWTDVLDDIGITVTTTNSESECGTGGNCVHVEETYQGTGCAELRPGLNSPNGVFYTPPAINLRPDWRSTLPNGPARVARSLAHELGHAFGLTNSECAVGDSIMAPVLDCTTTTGLTLEPTVNDVLPITSSTYGNGVRKLCGF